MVVRTNESQTAFPFDDCNEIRRLADRYWELISSTEANDERHFEEDFARARREGFLSKELFVRVGRWKSTRQTPNYESNSAESIRAATAAALRAADESAAVSALTRLNGVALRTASAILHWMRPDEFVIIDVRVVGALGWEEPKTWEDVNYYTRVSARIRQLARECKVNLRTMDRALWSWDKLRGLTRQ